MIKGIKNLTRGIKILYVLHKYNILSKLPFLIFLGKLSLFLNFYKKNSLKLGERLAIALEELGPIFVKIGQTLSTRPDIIGYDVAGDLVKLQDQLTPFSFDLVKGIIESSFSKDINIIFKDFSEKPISAASIAQVHYAKLHNDTEVAVKILRPNIQRQFKKDIDLLYFIARILEFIVPNSERLKATEIVKNFEQNIKVEIDLTMEAAAANTLAEFHLDDNNIIIPKIYLDYSSEKILTMEWVNGVSIYDTEKILKFGLCKKNLAKNLAQMFFYQAYDKGFYHADLHPGNILINEKGQIIILDFGIMGRLEYKIRIAMAEILYNLLSKNYMRVAEIYFEVGFVPKSKSKILLTQSLRAVCESIVGRKANEISIAELIAKLLKLSTDFEMITNTDLFALQKTLTLVEGIGYKLDPEINMWSLASPWIEEWAIKNIGIEAKMLKATKFLLHKFLYGDLS